MTMNTTHLSDVYLKKVFDVFEEMAVGEKLDLVGKIPDAEKRMKFIEAVKIYIRCMKDVRFTGYYEVAEKVEKESAGWNSYKNDSNDP